MDCSEAHVTSLTRLWLDLMRTRARMSHYTLVHGLSLWVKALLTAVLTIASNTHVHTHAHLHHGRHLLHVVWVRVEVGRSGWGRRSKLG